jgi:hypothetical protein
VPDAAIMSTPWWPRPPERAAPQLSTNSTGPCTGHTGPTGAGGGAGSGGGGAVVVVVGGGGGAVVVVVGGGAVVVVVVDVVGDCRGRKSSRGSVSTALPRLLSNRNDELSSCPSSGDASSASDVVPIVLIAPASRAAMASGMNITWRMGPRRYLSFVTNIAIQ